MKQVVTQPIDNDHYRLSIHQFNRHPPEFWEREAFEEKFYGAPEAPREPGEPSAGELGRLTVRSFFSAGMGWLA